MDRDKKGIEKESGVHISETVGIGILLALSGGFMDAYSYMARGQVFANAQTGNILLFGIALSSGRWGRALAYLLPVVSFAAGIFLSDLARLRWGESRRLHWKQAMLFAESLLLLSVAYIPGGLDFAANALTSFACGIQVESFRRIRGNSIATTMCIGNLRSGAEHISLYFAGMGNSHLKRGGLYFFVIFCFAMGAVLGERMVLLFGQRAIMLCSGLLLVTCLLLFFPQKAYNGVRR